MKRPRFRKGSAMSKNTVNAALRFMGYVNVKEEMTGHGFRTMASTLLNELGYDLPGNFGPLNS